MTEGRLHPVLFFLHQLRGGITNVGIRPHSTGSRQSGAGGRAVLPLKRSDAQAKAMGHQGSPRTEATSDAWDRPTLVYRPSCPGYFTAEPEPVPSPELDSRDELTCSNKCTLSDKLKHIHILYLLFVICVLTSLGRENLLIVTSLKLL